MPYVIDVLIVLALVLVGIGGVGMTFTRRPLDQLHLLTPVSTLAVPVFAVAAMLVTGPTLASLLIGVIAVVTVVSGAVLVVAVGRALADEAGADVGRSPE